MMINNDNRLQASITLQEEKFVVSGDLNFSNIPVIYEKGLREFNHHQQLLLDFSEVRSSNSAGLALIIEWLRYARKNNIKISFDNLPHQWLTIAKTSGIVEIL